MASWRVRRIKCIFKTRNAIAWAPDQRVMNQNANHAYVWSPDQRLIQTKFIKKTAFK
jgi:hypothetical protein